MYGASASSSFTEQASALFFHILQAQVSLKFMQDQDWLKFRLRICKHMGGLCRHHENN
jgi:hypothetical protein